MANLSGAFTGSVPYTGIERIPTTDVMVKNY